MGTNVKTVFFIFAHLGHGWDTGAKIAQEVHDRARQWNKRGTRGAREGHERCIAKPFYDLKYE